MRASFAKYFSPAVDIIEHSTVLAIGIDYVSIHWATPVVIVAVIAYVVIHYAKSVR